MKKKILLTITLATIGLTSFLLPSVWAHDIPIVPGKWWERPAVKDELGLSPDQVNKINNIWTEHRKRIIDTRGDIEKAYLDLEHIMGQPTLDTQAAYRLAESLGQLQAKQAEERIRMAIDIRQELSAEQFEKLRGLRHELKKRHKARGPTEGKLKAKGPREGKKARRGLKQD
jgi:Spy/CpxP family protein refolding chaperone